MHVIVHAGLPKTGSSAIQEYLAVHREQLRAANVIYPDLGDRSHWLLAAALSEDPAAYHQTVRRLDAGDVDREVERAFATVKRTFAEAPSDATIVLSHESFAVEDRMERTTTFLKTVLPGDAQTTWVAYARNPVEHYASGLQNALRTRHTQLRTPSAWKSPHPERALALKERFGDRAILRPFARSLLSGGDVILDFRNQIAGISGAVLPDYEPGQVTSNSSLSAAACGVLYVLRTFAENGSRPAQMVRRKLPGFDRAAGGPKMTIPQSWKQTLATKNSKVWNDVVARLSLAESEKQPLLLTRDPEATKISIDEVHTFLLSQVSDDYLKGLTTYLKAEANSSQNDRSVAADWLETTVAPALREGFAPVDGIFGRRRVHDRRKA